jgi:hypothetical protein
MNATNSASHATGLGGDGKSIRDASTGSSTGIALDQTGKQPAAANTAVSVAGDRHAAIGHALVAVDDQIGTNIVLRAGDFVALSGDRASFEAHRRRSTDDSAAVVC